MQVNLLKLLFRVRKSILSLLPYLFTGSLISLLQCFPFFVLPVWWYYSSPICLCSKQQITVWLFLSSGQLNVCFLFRLSASLPHCPQLLIFFASVCPLLFMECKTAGVQRSSLELLCPQPSPNHCQEIMERPCQRQEASCHLRHATSPALYPAFSSSLINTFMWGWSNDCVYWLI